MTKVFDITRKRALETADIELVDGEGAPIINDDGIQPSTTMFGPGSKVWQQADAERRRSRISRIEKSRGRVSAAVDHGKEDEVEFLVAITKSFNHWTYPHPDAENGGVWASDKEMFRAAYSDDSIGFIRDHHHAEASGWGAFTKGSAKS